jgi:hypothetical protein
MLFLATSPRIPSRFPLAVVTPDTPRYSLKVCKPLALHDWQNVPSGKWSDWVTLEVCNPTHHVYGIVAPVVCITVISDASHLEDNDTVRAWWRDQPTKTTFTGGEF